MKRQDLIDRLSDMQFYSLLDDDSREILNIPSPTKSSNRGKYSAETDKRFSELFAWVERPKDIKKAAIYADSMYLLSFAIVCYLTRGHIMTPSQRQLNELLKIGGYTWNEIAIFANQTPYMASFAVASMRQIPVAYFLTKLLGDVLNDHNSAKPGKSKMKASKESALDRLRAVVDYMDQNNLLLLAKNMTEDYSEDRWARTPSKSFVPLDSPDDKWVVEEYEDYVVAHVRIMCQRVSGSKEIAQANKETQKRLQQIDKETERELQRLMKQKRSQPEKKPAVNPLIKPNPLLMNPLSEIRPGKDGLLSSTGLTTGPLGMPSPGRFGGSFTSAHPFPNSPEMLMSDLIDNPRRVLEGVFDEEQIASFERRATLHGSILKTIDFIVNRGRKWEIENEEALKKTVSIENMAAVAEGAFLSILNGDEIFHMEVGRFLMSDIVSQSDLPIPAAETPDLEDEEDWIPDMPGENGDLELPVLTQKDVVTLTSRRDNVSKIPVTVSALLSRLSHSPIMLPLYLRKSHMKLFREHGFSERRSRDFAIIAATLDMAGNVRGFGGSVMLPEEFENGDADVDERVAAGVASAQSAQAKAEREMKRMEREVQFSRHEKATLEREVERLQQELKKKDAEIKKRDELLELYENMAEDESDEISLDTQFPFHTDKKVVLYGGFPVFHKELEKYIPGIRIIEHAAHIDVGPVRSADIVFVQINKTSHSNYWNVCDNCRNFEVPFYHLNYASAKRCAVEMVKQIRKLGK